MKSKTHRFNLVRTAVLAAMAGGLVACGGDGGDAPPPPLATLDLTAANSETVAHATAASVFAFGGASSAVPLGGGSGMAAQGASVQTLGYAAAGRPAAWLPQRVVDALMNAVRADRALANSRRAQPLAVVTSPPEPCGIAGTVTVTVDDRDNNGELSLGDLFTIAFSNCQDSAFEVLNGTANASVTRVGATVLPSFGARMSMTQLSQEALDGRHGLSVSGAVVLDYEQTSSTSETMTLTAEGPVVLKVHTHQAYDDTVTLQHGFAQISNYDSGPGVTRINVTGSFSTAAAGGSVFVATPRDIEVTDTDIYPMAGTVKVEGGGSMVLTALSAASVQIDLDADADNSYESRQTKDWDWLY
jgi:hypothetical protein